jgi:hypothetical protein
MGMRPQRGTIKTFLGAVGGVRCGEWAFAGAVGVTLLILAPPALPGLPPDPESIQGHLATCPHCSDLESNPARCGVMMEMSLRRYRRGLEVVRRHPR